MGGGKHRKAFAGVTNWRRKRGREGGEGGRDGSVQSRQATTKREERKKEGGREGTREGGREGFTFPSLAGLEPVAADYPDVPFPSCLVLVSFRATGDEEGRDIHFQVRGINTSQPLHGLSQHSLFV